MRKYIIVMLLTIGWLSTHAQISNMLDTEFYNSRVKLLSEFMRRFNGEEIHPYIDQDATDIQRMNLCQLFDIDYVVKNRPKAEAAVFQFVDSVLHNNVKLHYEDPEWYAKVKCVGRFKGKETQFHIILTVEPRGNDMYKWVISDVEGDIFEIAPSRNSEKIMLLPNEHESNFMRLNTLTSENDDYIMHYSTDYQQPNPLIVFNTLVYYDYLNIEYVSDIEYKFLQVPGYLFTVREYERDSTNSGWLISEWVKITDVEKDAILNRLYHGFYLDRLKSIDEKTVVPITSPKDTLEAINMVESFVKLLNEYIKNKSNIEDIKKEVNGRYTFIISEDMSNQLSKYYKEKPQKTYKIDSLLSWLCKTNCPIESIAVSNLDWFFDDSIRPDYKDGYTLIKCDLMTSGDLSVNEEVVFFIYKNQIAGIKLLSECF